MPDPAASAEFSERWRRWRARMDLDAYDERWSRMAVAGQDVHGEADFVDRLDGQVVLDAGCGTGRVAVELARRGRQVVAVDNDPEMLARARPKSSAVRWVEADLAAVSLPEWFDTIVMAGNILAFVIPTRRHDVVTNLARHLTIGGSLVVGAGVESSGDDRVDVDGFDEWCATAGLVLTERFAGWDRQPFADGGDYRVSVHVRQS